jgi:hypothetical protein
MSGLWMVVVLVVVLAPAVAIAVGRNEGRRSRQRAAAAVVVVDAVGVRRELADGRVEQVDWSEVTVIEVVRASMGPHKASGGVVLVGADDTHGALVPLDRVAACGLLGRLDGLAGFDRRRFDQAVTARAPSRTVVWRRPPPAG